MTFHPNRKNDAYFVVRGFVYQVDLTILSWINLAENEVLELERGEDIDKVTKNFNDEEILRDLCQVKHRGRNITLKSDGILNIFFNYFDHLNSSSEAELLFRFITNANCGVERPAIFPEGKKGIERWLELSDDANLQAENEDLLILQDYLLEQIKSEIVEDETGLGEKELETQKLWKKFLDSISKVENFLSFLKGFKWSLNNESAEDIATKVKEQLVLTGKVTNLTAANQAYPKLFLDVFKLLSREGIKTLNAQLLSSALESTDLSQEDQAVVEFINKVTNEIEEKVEELDERIETVEMRTQALEVLVNEPAHKASTATVFNYQLLSLSTGEPDLIKNGTERKDKVESLLKRFDDCSWVNFQGINGCGKSQLARLIAENFNVVHWVEMRPYNGEPDKCSAVVKAFLEIISGQPIHSKRSVWLHSVVNSLEPNTVLVFNDLPKYIDNEETHALIAELVDVSKGDKIRVLSTSNHKIERRCLERIESETFFEYYDFDFNENEVKEYLNNLSAPVHVIKGAEIIRAISLGNPRLVSAIIYHLKNKGWGESIEESLISVLDKKITNEILNSEQDSITNLISDTETKELLYRLSLLYWEFGKAEVEAISTVESIISHPYAKLRTLINVWIQETSDQLYLVSPLIKNIGTLNLSESTLKDVYKSVAITLVKDKNIDGLSGTRSISFFIRAEEYDNAAILLMNVLGSAQDSKGAKAVESWGFLQFWSSEGLPASMNVTLKVKTRVEQLRVFRLASKTTDYIIERLDSLIKKPELPKSDKVFARLALIANYKEFYNTDILDHIEQTLHDWGDISTEFKEMVDLSVFGSSLWFPIKLIIDNESLTRWLELANKVEANTGKGIFEDLGTQAGVQIIASQILNHENQNDKNWQRVSEVLTTFADYFKAKGFQVMEATVLRELIALKYDLQKEKEQAVSYTSMALSTINEPIARYYLFENIGKWLFKDKQIEEARSWLEKALEISAEDELNYIDTLLYGASAFSEEDSSKSVGWCEKSLELASNNNDVDELDIVFYLGELGIAYWVNKDYKNAYDTFGKVVDELFSLKERKFGEYWVRLFMWTGHSLGYIAADIKGEKVPQKVADGGDYVKPYQGIYTFNTKDLSDFYNPNIDAHLCVHMAMIADGVNLLEETYEWSTKAFDFARRSLTQSTLIMISNVCAPYLIVNFKVVEALETQLMAAAISRYFDGSYKGRDDEFNNLDLKELYNQKPSDVWTDAEDTALIFGVIPMFVLLLHKLNTEESASSLKNDFLNPLKDYYSKASDKGAWGDFIEVTEAIANESVSSSELVQRANEYGQNNKDKLKVTCVLGVIFIEKPSSETIKNIINVIPYIHNIQRVHSIVIKTILVPFVRYYVIESIKEDYVGTKDELQELIIKVNEIDPSDKSAVHQMLMLTVDTLDVEIIEERLEWLKID
jgi:tetratricopeptide (TPR) repeat protein